MYKPTIGLEIHIELNTASKMFCSCRNDSEEKMANTNICPICMGHPGSLPAINKEAVKKVLKTALSLNCQINRNSFFERKNYFYPDLPKGYQISQYMAPFGKGGYLEIPIEKFKIQPSSRAQVERNSKFKSTTQKSKLFKKIKIRRVHLEEDTGKLIHPAGTDYSLVDFNRAGIPLMELVTEPDIECSKEAREFVKELQILLRYLGVSRADMEKGEMRCEVNISLRKSQIPNPKSQTNPNSQIPNSQLGTKVEVKNLNSLRVVEKAIEYEIRRQTEILERGEKVIQETRGWHDKKELTFSQREKEESFDYRYFPEPDLPPLQIKEESLEQIKSEIPELPVQKRQRFRNEYFLSDKEVELYISQKDLGDYFEEVISELRNWVQEKKPDESLTEEEFRKLIKLASNYIATDLRGILKEEPMSREKFPITAENFAEFISMVYLGEISSKIAKTLLLAMFESGQDPSQIMEEKGLKLITDQNELEAVIKEVISENSKAVEDYKKGKETAIQFLIGKVMAKTKGTASPDKALKALKKALQ